MYYVSEYNRVNDTFGITDTEDGVTEFYKKDFILKAFKGIHIEGVSGKNVKVVNALATVAQSSFDKFGDIIRKKVNTFSEDVCLDLARSAHFVKKINKLTDINEIRRITADNIYPKNIQDVVAQASEYSNNLIEVNVSDPNAIKQALLNNVCLILQHKTNGVLTAFICTGSLQIIDRIYGVGFFDGVYLTKMLYGYTHKTDSYRPRNTDTKKAKNPDLLNVFSCSLRFRNTGVHHDGATKELSNPFYSVNIPRVLGMFILDNPARLGDRILPEFHRAHRQDTYEFDFDLYKEVMTCLEDGCNYFGNHDKMLSYIDMNNLTKTIDVNDLCTSFTSNFDYMEYLRLKMRSFS